MGRVEIENILFRIYSNLLNQRLLWRLNFQDLINIIDSDLFW